MDTAAPSSRGVDPDAISRFIDTLEAIPGMEPHGVIIHRHGRRITEGYWAPHAADNVRLVYSLSKSFTGTALGLMIADGHLGLDDPVARYLPEYFVGADDMTRRMRIRDIASMSSGHDREMYLEALTADREDPLRGFFSIAPDAEPGTLFAYNQPPVLALATILQRLAGERLVDYLRPRVLDPIGAGEVTWVQFTPGVDLGFSGVHTTLDTIARLGQLYLDGGRWNGSQIVPADWVAQASAVQTPNPMRDEPDWRQGYGFQLWRSQHGYRGDGAFGQYMIVLPEYDAVVAIFSCIENMQLVMDAVWEHLLPAMGDAPIDADDGDAALAVRLAGLRLRPVAERRGGRPGAALDATSYVPGEVRDSSQRTVTAIDVDGDTAHLREHGDTGVDTITVALNGDWTRCGEHAASCATTLDDGRVAIDVAFLACPHRLEVVLEPASGTFTTRWPLVPLFGAGLRGRLATMHPPA